MELTPADKSKGERRRLGRVVELTEDPTALSPTPKGLGKVGAKNENTDEQTTATLGVRILLGILRAEKAARDAKSEY